MLLHHAAGQASQLQTPCLQAGVEVGVLEGGSHLMAQRQQEFFVQCCKWIAGLAHQSQGSDYSLAPQNRQNRSIRKSRGVSVGAGPLRSKLRPSTLDSSPQHRGGGIGETSVGPGGTHPGSLNELKVGSLGRVQRRSAYGGQGQGAGQEDIEHVLFPAGPLKISGKGGQRTEAPAKII